VPEQTLEEPFVSSWSPTAEVAETIRAEAFLGLKSLPRRGAEVGGFVFARGGSGGSNAEHAVDGVEFVPTEHLFGPHYRLSTSDLDLFRSKTREVRSNFPGAILGYFRTCTRDEFQLDDHDLQLLHDVLPDARFIYLVKPFQSGDSRVRVFAADDSLGSPYISEFPLQLNLDVHPESVRASDTATIETPSPAPWNKTEETTESRPEQDSPGRNYWKPVLITALAAVAVFAAAWSYGRWKSPPQPELNLAVETASGNIHLKWDHKSPAFRSAETGTLWITDQGNTRELSLNPSTLGTGSLVYVTDTPDVTFRMQLPQKSGHPLTGSVRVIRDIPTPPAQSAKSAEPTGAPAAEPVKPKPPVRATRRTKPAQRFAPVSRNTSGRE
jgi:hypothetical protein